MSARNINTRLSPLFAGWAVTACCGRDEFLANGGGNGKDDERFVVSLPLKQRWATEGGIEYGAQRQSLRNDFRCMTQAHASLSEGRSLGVRRSGQQRSRSRGPRRHSMNRNTREEHATRIRETTANALYMELDRATLSLLCRQSHL
jgi:hypothetical protein